MTTTRKRHRQVGDVLQHDSQSDLLQGSYRLVEHLGGIRWLAEQLPPDDALVDRLLAMAAADEASGSYPLWATAEDVLAEITERTADAGRTFTIQFVSRDAWDAMF